MLNVVWRKQVRRVERLNRKVDDWACQEKLIRAECGLHVKEVFTRFETLAVIGATGAVWASRIKDDQGDARSRPLIALAGAAFLVNRWRRLARHFTTRVRKGRWYRLHQQDKTSADKRQRSLELKDPDINPTEGTQ